MIITLGNQPSGEDNGAIYDLQEDGTLTFEFELNEQGNQNLPSYLPTGEVVIVGSDPCHGDNWDFGNLYVRQNGTWTKKRTIPLMLHGFGQTIHDGKLYVTGGSHENTGAEGYHGRVYWSSDLGDTWDSAYVCYYRCRDIISYNNKLWATSWEYYTPPFNFYKSEDNGLTWTKVEGITPYQWPRMIIYDNKLYVTNVNKTSLSVIDSSDNVSEIELPGTMQDQNNTANYLAVGDNSLFVLLEDGKKVYKYNGSSWTLHCELVAECCSLINFEDKFLITSTMGETATILKIPF